MIDIKLLRDNPDLVRENIKKKFQDAKLPLVESFRLGKKALVCLRGITPTLQKLSCSVG